MRRSLLESIPSPYARTANGIYALSVAVDGEAWAEVADGILRISVTTGTAPDLYIALRDYSLTGLVTYLNTVPGYSATIHPDFTAFRQAAGLAESHFGAWALADGSVSLDRQPNLSIGTNVLLQLLGALGLELAVTKDKIDGLSRNVLLPSTTGRWLDDWGELYGIARERQSDGAAEPDAVYRRRIVLELIHPRASNQAMRQIIRARWPVRDVGIEDDLRVHPDDAVKQALGQPWRRLNPYHFLATMEIPAFGGFTDRVDALIDLITRIKPWGTSFEVNLRSTSTDGPVIQDITDERLETFLIDDRYNTLGIRDLAALALTDIHNEPLLRSGLFLLTLRPGGHTSALNPLDNKNADRTTLGPNEVGHPELVDTTLGTGRAIYNWVTTILDEWYDVTVYLLPEDVVRPRDDGGTWIDILVSDEQKLVSSFTETWVEDDRTYPSYEPVLARRPLFRANDAFSRTQSPFARVNAHTALERAHKRMTLLPLPMSMPPEQMIRWLPDYSNDLVDGVPLDPPLRRSR